MMSAWAALLLAAAEGAVPAAAPAEPALVISEAKFPYPSWDAAMDAMIANREAAISVKNGWTIVDEVVDGVHVSWALTPEGHPAHPSVVRRTPIRRDGEVAVEMSYRCDARNQSACAGLIEEFRGLNKGTVEEFKRRLGLLEHPRKAEALEFAERYLGLVDQGKDDESLAMLTSYSRSGYTAVAWREELQKQRGKRGAFNMRRLSRLEWFENPAGVELEGTFAFMEFETFYESGYLRQYVVLHSDKGAPFRVMNDEAPFLRLIAVRRAQ